MFSNNVTVQIKTDFVSHFSNLKIPLVKIDGAGMKLKGLKVTFPSALEQCLFKVFEHCSHALVYLNRESISLHCFLSNK